MDPKIEIEFDSLSKTYEPSDNVSGRVIIISPGEAYHLAGVVLRMEGRRVAHVSPQFPEEFYFLEKHTVLLENGSNIYFIDIRAILPIDGTLEYSFRLELPHELPSSFRASRACIEYHLVIIAKQESNFDLTVKSPFYVKSILDESTLKEHAKLLTPLEIRRSKAFGCCSCFNWLKISRFGMTAKLQKSIFYAGEDIPLSLFIWNTSESSPLHPLKISLTRPELLKELNILDAGNYRTVMKEYGELLSIPGPGISPRQKVTWTSVCTSPLDNTTRSFKLSIPEDTPPTHLGCQKIIKLNYFITIFIESVGICSPTLLIKLPIVIGSKSSRSRSQESQPEAEQTDS